MSHHMLGASSTTNNNNYTDVYIDGGKMLRSDRTTGTVVYILSAKALSIAWGDEPHYWRWVAHADSRFSKVAELQDVCWFDISGKIDCKELPRKTNYTTYFIFKIKETSYGLDAPQKAVISMDNNRSTRIICLEPVTGTRYRNITVPQARSDGWMEIQLGEFHYGDEEDGEVMMKLSETKNGRWKSGLIVEGIEIRSKPLNQSHS